MEKEIVQDDFYKSGPDPKPTKPSRPRRHRSSGDDQFDQKKIRKARSKNRGIRRMFRQLRTKPDFRMKILWTFAGVIVAAILTYAIYDSLKWRRINDLPEDERATAMEQLLKKNRKKDLQDKSRQNDPETTSESFGPLSK